MKTEGAKARYAVELSPTRPYFCIRDRMTDEIVYRCSEVKEAHAIQASYELGLRGDSNKGGKR